MTNGDYVVQSYNCANGATPNAGAITFVPGSASNGGFSMQWAYDYANGQLVVGRPADNIVTFFGKAHYRVSVPIVYQ